jgi:nicotinate phosphoribosyltransferase
MLSAALREGIQDRHCVFEVFARSLPTGRSFGLLAGTERVIDAITSFRFNEEQLAWLLSEGVIDGLSLSYFRNFSFSGNVSGYQEGELYFSFSPVLRVEGTLGECLVLETVVLSVLNHDCAVASTAAQMIRAAKGRRLIEMGSRRTNDDSAVHAARAAYIAGFESTSNLEAGFRYGVPTGGTAAHSWTLAHENEYEAFIAQMNAQGPKTTVLVDTYDVATGVENAVRAAKEFGIAGPGAVRIDSGDILASTRAVRCQLDELGATETNIIVTGDMDQKRIGDLLRDSAPIDAFGVGSRLVTGENCPSPGFVYKLMAIENHTGEMVSVAKTSAAKINAPGASTAYRVPASEAQNFAGKLESIIQHVEVLAKEGAQLEVGSNWESLQQRLLKDGERVGTPRSLAVIRDETIERVLSAETYFSVEL